MRKFCDYFLIFPYFLYSIRQILCTTRWVQWVSMQLHQLRRHRLEKYIQRHRIFPYNQPFIWMESIIENMKTFIITSSTCIYLNCQSVTISKTQYKMFILHSQNVHFIITKCSFSATKVLQKCTYASKASIFLKNR